MNGFINGFSLNGAAYPNWIVRAAVVAVAAATVSVAPTRITYASAYGDAVVAVYLTPTHTIQARCNASAGASVSVSPTLIYAGRSTNTANATGNASVRRDVFASAGGDAHCTALALTAQALGEATATAVASVVSSRAHIVFPGRASVVASVSTVACSGDVTRYPRVSAALGSVVYTRAEAKVKYTGHSYYNHDGYVVGASATAVATVPQDHVKVVATLGTFDYGNSSASAHAFIRYAGHLNDVGAVTSLHATPTLIQRPTSATVATCTAAATGTRVVLPLASATSGATTYSPKALMNHAGGVQTTGGVVAVACTGVRMAFGDAQAIAGADTPGVAYGMQYMGTASALAEAVASVTGKYLGAARATGSTTAVSYPVAYGNQFFGTGLVSEGACAAVRVIPTLIYHGFANASALASVGRAYAVANSEIPAPDTRRMLVPSEDRGMTVFAEDRTMVVTA